MFLSVSLDFRQVKFFSFLALAPSPELSLAFARRLHFLASNPRLRPFRVVSSARASLGIPSAISDLPYPVPLVPCSLPLSLPDPRSFFQVVSFLPRPAMHLTGFLTRPRRFPISGLSSSLHRDLRRFPLSLGLPVRSFASASFQSRFRSSVFPLPRSLSLFFRTTHCMPSLSLPHA